jgi:D-sedoheptulose 7-phosphate isomerase
MREHLQTALDEAARLSNWLREDRASQATLLAIAQSVASSLRAGGRVLSCGNGGSMCDAMHLAEEMTGRFERDRAPLSAMAISDPSHLTCSANDFGFEMVFARGVQAWGRKGDVLVGLSTSGNSPNVLRAVEAARSIGMVVVGFLGKGGGRMLPLCDHAIVVPSARSDRTQEIHIQLIHCLIELVERQLHPENYPPGEVRP